jgi:hypothetical protein
MPELAGNLYTSIQERAMATETRQFYYYDTYYYNGNWCEALILCSYAGSYVGRIVFYKDDAAIPPPKGPPWLSVHYPVSRFNDIVSMLRYERPLHLSVTVTDDVSVGSVQTTHEPVGEEEAGHPSP